MAVTVTRSTDPGAAVLSGASGALIPLLDQQLLARGWTKPFSDSHQAVYRQGLGSYLRYYRVKDDGHSAAAGDWAYVTGYEAMTSVSAGTGPQPSPADTAQLGKSRTQNDPGPLAWIIAGDHATVHLAIQTGLAGAWSVYTLGDFFSEMAVDPFRAGLMVACNGTVPSVFSTAIDAGVSAFPGLNTAACLSIGRSYTGAGAALQTAAFAGNDLSLYGDMALVQNLATVNHGYVAYPTPAHGGAMVAEIHLAERAAALPRARLRGLYHWGHSETAIAHGAQVVGVGPFAGKTFEMIRPLTSPDTGVVLLEVSDTWLTNADHA